MRFHLFGLAHIPVMWDRCCCRLTTLVWNMARMLKRHGQEVVLYGSAGSDAPCAEFVEIVGPETLRTEYRPDDPLPVKWNRQQRDDRPAWIEHRARGRLELKRRFVPGDVGLISCGAFQRFVAAECWAATEFIAGYPGVCHWSRVFPSAAWMYYQYGRLNQQSGLQSWDAVVPHFLDPSDFPFDPERKPAGYLLFLGRLSQAKGVDLAMQIARASGLPLVVAGQAESGPGVPDWLSGLAAQMGNGVRLVGQVDHARRCELLAGAAGFSTVFPGRARRKLRRRAAFRVIVSRASTNTYRRYSAPRPRLA